MQINSFARTKFHNYTSNESVDGNAILKAIYVLQFMELSSSPIKSIRYSHIEHFLFCSFFRLHLKLINKVRFVEFCQHQNEEADIIKLKSGFHCELLKMFHSSN